MKYYLLIEKLLLPSRDRLLGDLLRLDGNGDLEPRLFGGGLRERLNRGDLRPNERDLDLL